jgi:hypothetical protein
MNGNLHHALHVRKFLFLTPPFVTSCYCTSLCMYHLILSRLVQSIVLLEILTRHIMNGTLALAYLIQTVNFSTSICYELLLCVHHYACTTSASPSLASKIALLHITTWDIDSGRLCRTLSIPYKQIFLFLDTSICYELLLCVHHYACTTSACTKFERLKYSITWDIDSAILWTALSYCVSHNESFISQHLHLLRAVTLCTHYACTTSACLFSVSSIVLLEILTPPYYERHLAHASHTNESFNFNTSICYELLCVHHYVHVPSATKFSV